MEIRKPFENPPAIWKWIKKEIEADNVESVSLETTLKTMDIEEGRSLKYVASRKVIIELGPDLKEGGRK